MAQLTWAARLRPLLLALAATSCAGSASVTLEDPGQALIIHRPALYPETILYNNLRDTFLVSSFREGAVYEVNRDGRALRIVDDARLCSVLGIALDLERGRIWAVNSDFGASLRPSTVGAKRLAAVGVYELATGKALHYVDLAPLTSGMHLLNGIALDAGGNAYVTDSFSPTIYKVDAQGAASVFLRDDRFAGDGINLNGLVVHPDGYLLVIKKSDGALFRVPLAHPSKFAKVQIDDTFVGGDGLLLVGRQALVVIANQVPGTASNAAFSLSSTDGWRSAKLRQVQKLGDVYPTTGVLRDGKLYVLHSKLNELIQSPPEEKAQLRVQATIQQIGKVAL